MDKKDFDYYFAQLRKTENHREKKAEVEIRKLYKELLADTKQFIAEEYYELSEEGELTYEILRSKGQNARFLAEVEQRLNDLSPKVSDEIQQAVESMYGLAYDGMVNAVQKSATRQELEINLAGLRGVSVDTVKAAVENPVAGLTLNDTLEKNRKNIIWNIKREIGVGLTQGDRYATMAKRIAKCLDGDYKKAIRIVRTETGRVREAGHFASAKDINDALGNGTTNMRLVKTWKTMKDKSVRDTHGRMEGVTVAMDEYFELPSGVKTLAPKQSGVASEDINCRCFVKYHLMEQAAKAPTLPDYMTVEEFEKVSAAMNDYAVMTADKFREATGLEISDFARLDGNTWMPKMEFQYNELSEYGVTGLDIVDDRYGSRITTVGDLVEHFGREVHKEFDGVYDTGYSDLFYVQSATGSHNINLYLRAGKDKKAYSGQVHKSYASADYIEKIETVVAALDNKIAQNTLAKDMVVDRWAGENFLTDCLKLDTSKMQLAEKAYGGRTRIGHAYVSNVDVSKVAEEINRSLVGSVLTDKAFMSTSAVAEKNVFIGSTVRMKIIAPKGTNAFVTTNVAESEVIFGRDTKLEIIGAQVSSNKATDSWEGEFDTKSVELLVKIVGD